MFRWASPQPLPTRLEELLDRAQAVRCDWFERAPVDVLVFLPPHQLLGCGRLPLAGLLASYRMLLEAADHTRQQNNFAYLLNGDRLLALNAEELSGWRAGLPLPRACALQSPAPLEAVFTAALLAAEPELEKLYLLLDEQAERGGAAPEQGYGSRLRQSDAAALVDNWNRQLERRQTETDLELVRLQLLEVEQECERQFLSNREAGRKLSWQRRVHEQAVAQLEQYGGLLQRLQVLQGRAQ
jgi:hypothetical protein